MTRYSVAASVSAFGVAIAAITTALDNGVFAASPTKTLPTEDKEYVWYEHIENEAKAGRAGTELPTLIAGIDGLDLHRRVICAQLLYVVGPEAAPAVPALIRHVDDLDFDTRLRCIEALGGIGPRAAAAVPELIGALNDPDYPISNMAAWALGEMGAKAQMAVPMLEATIRQRPKDSYYYAMIAATCRGSLAHITGKPGVQVMALISMLNESDDAKNYNWPALEAIRKLAELMPASSIASEDICQVLMDLRAAPVTRAAAAADLGIFLSPSAVPFLVEAAQDDPDLSVRGSAIGALEKFKGSKVNITKLRRDLQDAQLRADEDAKWRAMWMSWLPLR